MAAVVVEAVITEDQEARIITVALLAAAVAAGLPMVTPLVLCWSLLGFGWERFQATQTTNRLNGTLGQVNGVSFSFSRCLHLTIYFIVFVLFFFRNCYFFRFLLLCLFFAWHLGFIEQESLTK
jgi:hypothetical protein